MIFSGATGISGRVVDNVFLYILVICLFLLGLITFLMVYFVIRYRRKRHPQPADIEGSTWLEVTWTVIPTLLVLTMFYYGMTGFDFLKKVPPGAMTVKVIARQWAWTFQYENGIEESELRVPVGKPIRLALTSKDVIHGFYAPAFRIKQDAVPGMTTQLWFQATRLGTFDVMCSQYCGLEHSHMMTKILVLSGEDFEKWREGKRQTAVGKASSTGEKLYQEKGCIGCHSLDGTRRVGPSFKDLFGKTEEVIVQGKKEKITVDEAFIRKFILNPNVVHIEGYPPIMPKIDLTEEEVAALVGFIKTVK
jgi:cytochrome c oxidase subunit II